MVSSVVRLVLHQCPMQLLNGFVIYNNNYNCIVVMALDRSLCISLDINSKDYFLL